jgi:hypothetical protein
MISVLQFQSAKIEGMPAIGAGQFQPANAPGWICLNCQPGWSSVHQLALQEEECQIRLEASVANMDFQTAASWRDRMAAVNQEIRGRLIGLGIDLPTQDL